MNATIKRCLIGGWRIILSPIIALKLGLEWERLNFRQLMKMSHGKDTKVDLLVWIQEGQNITLGNAVKISAFGSLLAGRNASIIIGDYTMVGPNTTICAINHGVAATETPYRYQPWQDTADHSISIGRNVWIGANCVILPGAVIGDNCIIAAGSVVRGRLDASTILVQKRINTKRPI